MQSRNGLSIAVLTMADVSSRFNARQPKKFLKAIYSEGDRRQTCLYRLCRQCRQCDRIIAVGGWQFDALKNYIDEVLTDELREKIITVFNPHYADYESGYSVYSGIKTALEQGDVKEIIFVEGDLVVDTRSLTKVLSAENDVITFNREPIESCKSVVLYEDAHGKFHYIYSYEHGLLSIEEPFRRVWNSGQAWKFTDIGKLEFACDSFVRECVAGVGLKLIQRYFDQISSGDVETVAFDHWFNCNTREDYSRAFNALSTEA